MRCDSRSRLGHALAAGAATASSRDQLSRARAGCSWYWASPAPREPRLTVGQTGKTPRRCSAATSSTSPRCDVAVLDDHSAIFPIDNLSQLRPGTYAVQALLHTNPDLNVPNAPGDLYSPVTTVRLDPAAGGTVSLELSHVVPEETLPPDTELVKYLKIRSRLLSDFHGRPIDLRAGVILPRDFARQPERRYPVRVHIGGYGSRFTERRRDDGPRLGISPRLDGRRRAADDPHPPGRRRARWATRTRSTRPTTDRTARPSRAS